MFKRPIFILLIGLSVALLHFGPVAATPIPAPSPEIESTSPPVDLAAVVSMDVPPRTKIPETPVNMYIMKGHNSRFKLFFTDIQYGYDLVDFEYYDAWCLQKNKRLRRNTMHLVTLYDSYDPNIPPEFRAMDMNRINYVINHKEGFSKAAVQDAVWHYSGTLSKPVGHEAARLIDEADEKGKDFKPAEGELLGIISIPEKGQTVLLEYLIPKSEFAVAPAFFVPPAAAVPAATFSWLPLLALTPLPFIPLIPDNPPTPPPTPPPPPVPEPSSLILLGSALVAIAVLRWNMRLRT